MTKRNDTPGVFSERKSRMLCNIIWLYLFILSLLEISTVISINDEVYFFLNRRIIFITWTYLNKQIAITDRDKRSLKNGDFIFQTQNKLLESNQNPRVYINLDQFLSLPQSESTALFDVIVAIGPDIQSCKTS